MNEDDTPDDDGPEEENPLVAQVVTLTAYLGALTALLQVSGAVNAASLDELEEAVMDHLPEAFAEAGEMLIGVLQRTRETFVKAAVAG